MRKSQARHMVTRKVYFHYFMVEYHTGGELRYTEVVLSTEEARRLTKRGLKKKLQLPEDATIISYKETKQEMKLLALDLDTFIELSTELEGE